MKQHYLIQSSSVFNILSSSRNLCFRRRPMSNLLYNNHMEGNDSMNTSSSSSSSPPQSKVIGPCAACKLLRRRCVEKCVLAPYFPPNDPLKFTNAHRVFGASNIIKFLQELPDPQRADAVSSMVYEANARVRDPVYGSAGAIFQLQRQIAELQEQLAKAQAEIVYMQHQHSNLMALICMERPQSTQELPSFDDFTGTGSLLLIRATQPSYKRDANFGH